MPLFPVVALSLFHAIDPSAQAALDAVAADFSKNCGTSAVTIDIDYAAFAPRYRDEGFLRDDTTATRACSDALGAVVSICQVTRQTVWAALSPGEFSMDPTSDLRPVAGVKKLRCRLPSYAGALDAIAAQHPEWPAREKMNNAAKLHFDDNGYGDHLIPELIMEPDTITVGFFEASLNFGQVGTEFKYQLQNLEYAKVLSGGEVGTTGRFAMAQKWANDSVKKFNKARGANAKFELDWKSLEQGWPGWTTWHDKGVNTLIETNVAPTFITNVVLDLAELCENDGDDRFKALSKIKVLKLTGDPRGAKVMAAKRAKPKKSIEKLRKELFPAIEMFEPVFSYSKESITVALWYESVNFFAASKWLEKLPAFK
jgi:hypothetical protein